MALMARVRGGPRERHWQILRWHWTGFAPVSVAGTALAVLSAIVGGIESKPAYRVVS